MTYRRLDEFKWDRLGFDNAERVRREHGELRDWLTAHAEYNITESDEVVPRTHAARPPAYKHKWRLRIFVACSDPDLYIFADDAKNKARHAYLQGHRRWTHEYTIDIVNVKIKVLDRLCLIQLTPMDGFEFEFATSANPIKLQAVTGGAGFPGQVYNGCIVGVSVNAVKGAIQTSAVIRGQKRTLGGADTSLIKRPYQIELFNEPVVYPDPVKRLGRTRYPSTIMESFAPGNPHTGVHLRGMGMQAGAGLQGQKQQFFQHEQRDIDFDVPYQTNHNKDAVVPVYIRGGADWPRAAAKQTVKDDQHGSREFGIYVDAFNQFWVFPTSAIKPVDPNFPYNQNVDPASVQMAVPILPAWCYVQSQKVSAYWASHPISDGHATVDLPEPDWKFKHDGTRAVSIFYERIPFTYDAATLGPPHEGTNPFTSTDFDALAALMGVQGRSNLTFAPGYNEQRYMNAPGIIEIAVNITLTGDHPEDFTVALGVREVRRPTTSAYCPLYVGYVWYDVPFGARKAVKQPDGTIKDERIGKIGQLVSLDIERWSDKKTISEIGVDNLLDSGKHVYRLYSIKDLDTGVELFTCRAFPIHGIDLTSLSLVMELYESQTVKKTMARKDGDPLGPSIDADVTTYYPTMFAIIGAKPKEILYPLTQFPADVKARLDTYLKITPTTAREDINARIATDADWHYLALNDSTDWSGDFQQWRLAQLQQNDLYINGSYAFPATRDQIERFLFIECKAYFDASPLRLTASPKFAWYAYEDEICNCAVASGDTTFYVHPSGTWCFWNNTKIFMPFGIPDNFFGNAVNYLTTFTTEDAAKIEHVIFDRVHFEIRTDRRVIAKQDTTFQKLYNTAVKKGTDAHTLEEGIVAISDADLRAVFGTDDGISTNPSAPDLKWAQIRATWNGVSYWYQEPAIQGGPYYGSVNLSQQAGTIGFGFAHVWNTAKDAAGNVVLPMQDSRHIRFANPIVLQVVSA